MIGIPTWAPPAARLVATIVVAIFWLTTVGMWANDKDRAPAGWFFGVLALPIGLVLLGIWL